MQLILLPWLVLALLATSAWLSQPATAQWVSSQQNATIRFEQQPFCPSAAQLTNLRLLRGSTAMSTCAVECAAQANCSAVHRAGQDCYLAGRVDWQDAWAVGDAGSCQRGNTSTLARLPLTTDALADRLILWLSPRVSLGNLANASWPPATLAGLGSRNSSGAVLPGQGDSYVQVNLADASVGLESRRGSLGQFAMFAKAEWQPRSYNSTYLVRGASSDPSPVVLLWLYEDNRRLKFGNRRASGDNFQTAVNILPGARAVNSVGVTFNGTQYAAYVNGAVAPVSSYSSLSATASVGSDIRLGAKHGDTLDGALAGRILCFAYWARDLTPDEFAAFDQIC